MYQKDNTVRNIWGGIFIGAAIATVLAAGVYVNGLMTDNGAADELVFTSVENSNVGNFTQNVPSYVQVDNHTIIITLGGSGSCAPYVESMGVEGTTVYLYEHQYGKRACTMDYRLYSYTLTVKDFGFSFVDKTLRYCNVGGCKMLPLTNSGVVGFPLPPQPID